MASEEVININELLNDKDKFYDCIRVFVVNSPKAKIEEKINAFAQRYNDEAFYKQAVTEKSNELIESGQAKNINLYAWRMFKIIHDQTTRAEINNRVTELEKLRKESERPKDEERIRRLFEALYIGKNKYKDEMKHVQDGRDKTIKEYKEELKKWAVIENKCKERNKLCIEFLEMMEAARSDFSEDCEVAWGSMTEEERRSEWFNDFVNYKNKNVETEMSRWIIKHENDTFVQYCLKKFSEEKEEEPSSIQNDVEKMIKENYLDFLNKEPHEDTVNDVKFE